MWSKGTPGLNGGTPDTDALCSDRFGNGAGGALSYVGPCDADGQADPGDADGERMNSVTVWFDGLYGASGGYIDPNGTQGWQNPCVDAAGAEVGCTLDVLCEENADARVAFDFTVMREANQGFFDIAVSFEDVFCSAKVGAPRGAPPPRRHARRDRGRRLRVYLGREPAQHAPRVPTSRSAAMAWRR